MMVNAIFSARSRPLVAAAWVAAGLYVFLFFPVCRAQDGFTEGLGYKTTCLGGYCNTIQGGRMDMPALAVVCFAGPNELPDIRLAGTVLWYGSPLAKFGSIKPAGMATQSPLESKAQTWNGNTLHYTIPPELKNGTYIEYRVNNLFPGLWAVSDALTIGLLQGRPPSDILFPVSSGFQHVPVPETLPAEGVAVPLQKMSENWFLCWFGGRKEWRESKSRTHFGSVAGRDAPWLVILQRKPLSAMLSASGLLVSFAKASGHVMAMPLYGIAHVPASETDKWRDSSLPASVAERCREWAQRSRLVPVRTKESFKVEDGEDLLRIRVVCEWERIADDWSTQARKFVPYWPLVGLLLRYNRFYNVPVESRPAFADAAYDTQYGPYFGVPDADEYEILIRGMGKYFLQGLKETRPQGALAERAAEEIRHRLAAVLAHKRDIKVVWSRGDERGSYSVGTKEHQVTAYAQTMYLLDGPERAQMCDYLRGLVLSTLLNPDNMKNKWYVGEITGDPAKEQHWRNTSNNGRMLAALWAYAAHTGDRQTIENNRKAVLAAFSVYQDYCDWLLMFPHTQGSLPVIPNLNEQVAGVIGLGRLARDLGWKETEDWCRYLAARLLLGRAAIWKGMSYMCDSMGGNPRNYIYPEMGEFAPDWIGEAKDAMSTKEQGWSAAGIHYSGDSTLYNAPWRGIFFLMPPEELRFFGEYFRADLIDITNFLSAAYPGIFLAPAHHQYTQEWGIQGSYYMLHAYAIGTPPERLWFMVPPDKAFVEDPFRILHLKALIDACAGLPWRDVAPGR